MKKSQITILVLLAGFGGSAKCFAADSYPLARQFDRTSALTNSAIVATLTFTNGGTNTLRGFFYGDEVPTNLTVNPLTVRISGRTVTNFVFEVGEAGDVYPGLVPLRWRLETPTNFAATNLLLPQAGVQITYSLTSSNPSSYTLPQFDWAAYSPIGTNAVFGYSQSSNQQVLNFVTNAATLPSLDVARAANGAVGISLSGTPGFSYVLDLSSNLANWAAVATNISPFTLTDTNAAAATEPRFYRGRILPGP